MDNKNKRKIGHTKVTITDFFKKKPTDVTSKFSSIRLIIIMCSHNLLIRFQHLICLFYNFSC